MENLVAGLLWAMGYNTNVSKIGPDKGVDIIAYPDEFGIKDPKIKVQVKHRKERSQMCPNNLVSLVFSLRILNKLNLF